MHDVALLVGGLGMIIGGFVFSGTSFIACGVMLLVMFVGTVWQNI